MEAAAERGSAPSSSGASRAKGSSGTSPARTPRRSHASRPRSTSRWTATDPVPHGPAGDRERARPRPARAVGASPRHRRRGADEPVPRPESRATPTRPPATWAAAPTATLRALRVPSGRLGRGLRGPSRGDRGRLRALGRPTLPDPPRHRARRGRAPDVLRLLRATSWDDGFPAAEMLPALAGTLSELGIDLAGQENVELDVEARPMKSPRAFCAPIEVPGRVVLVIQPMGGPDDWHALFHEAGHTEHYAHTSAEPRPRARRLGDNAVTEGWADALELLVNDPVWLSRRLDFGRAHVFARRGGSRAALPRPPLRGEAPLRARAARRQRRLDTCGRDTSSS